MKSLTERLPKKANEFNRFSKMTNVAHLQIDTNGFINKRRYISLTDTLGIDFINS